MRDLSLVLAVTYILLLAHERRVLRSEVKEIMEAWGNVTDIKEKELFITERKARVKEFMEVIYLVQLVH